MLLYRYRSVRVSCEHRTVNVSCGTILTSAYFSPLMLLGKEVIEKQERESQGGANLLLPLAGSASSSTSLCLSFPLCLVEISVIK